MNSLQNFRQNYRAQSHQNFNDDTLYQKQEKTKQTQNKVANMRYYKTTYKHTNNNDITINRSENCCNLPSEYKLLNISTIFPRRRQQSRNRTFHIYQQQ